MTLKPVLLLRGRDNDRDEIALKSLGIPSLSDSLTELTSGSSEDSQKLLALVTESEGWVVITSRNSIPWWAHTVGKESLSQVFTQNKKLKFAAIGIGSAETLRELGVSTIVTPKNSDSDGLLETLAPFPATNLFLPVGNLARRTISDGLKFLGWQVYRTIVYIIQPVSTAPKSIDKIHNGEISAVVLRSPSAARALHSLLPAPEIPIFCGGPITAAEARELGMNIAGIAENPTPESMATLVFHFLGSFDEIRQ